MLSLLLLYLCVCLLVCDCGDVSFRPSLSPACHLLSHLHD